VQAEGRRATSASFVFLVLPGPDAQAPSRLGLVTTKKVGNAVVRNRMRRLCREAFRLSPDYVPAGTWLVVIVRAALDGMGLEAVMAEWRKARPKVLTALQSFPKSP
jgi:ribonuclease P protein component